MKGIIPLIIGMAAVFIAVFTLFFIFDQIQKFADSCAKQAVPVGICKEFTGFTESILIIILIIAGFVIVISATAYILLSSGPSDSL